MRRGELSGDTRQGEEQGCLLHLPYPDAPEDTQSWQGRRQRGARQQRWAVPGQLMAHGRAQEADYSGVGSGQGRNPQSSCGALFCASESCVQGEGSLGVLLQALHPHGLPCQRRQLLHHRLQLPRRHRRTARALAATLLEGAQGHARVLCCHRCSPRGIPGAACLRLPRCLEALQLLASNPQRLVHSKRAWAWRRGHRGLPPQAGLGRAVGAHSPDPGMARRCRWRPAPPCRATLPREKGGAPSSAFRRPIIRRHCYERNRP